MTKKAQSLLPKGMDEVFDKTGAEQIAVFPQKGDNRLADLVILASADSKRQLNAMSEGIMRVLRDAGEKSVSEGEGTGWMIVDSGRIVVHLMEASMRELYALDALFKV